MIPPAWLTMLCIVASALVPLHAGAARAQRGVVGATSRLEAVESEVSMLERRLGILRGAIQGAPLSRAPSEVKDLLFEADFAFLTEDHDRAALLYYSLLENGDLQGHPGEADAQFHMAEALFRSENYFPAQTAYERIVSIGTIHPRYDDAVTKLIELFGITGEVDQFNYYYNNFLQTTRTGNGQSALRVRYALGRTMYLQGKMDEAKSMLANFPEGSTYTPQARYHYGEILVKEGYEAALAGDDTTALQRYQAAVPVFQDVVQLPTSTEDQEAVQHLAYLALGALHFEQGLISEAIGFYRQIPQESAQFADALFQMCWADILLEDYAGALRTIEIFLLAFPEDTREPELKLLMAHLRVKLEEFDQAVVDYKLVVEEYEEIKLRLDHLVGADIDPMVYFNQLVDKSYIVPSEYQVPDLAARMARQDRRLSQAVDVASSLGREQREIESGQETVARLEEAVGGGPVAGGMMTTYRSRRLELDGLDSQILIRESDLVEIEAAYLLDTLDAGAASEVRRIIDEQTRMDESVATVSAMYTDRTELREDVEVAAKALDTEAFKLETMLDDVFARAAGIELYLKNELTEGRKSDDEVQGFRLELQSIRTDLQDQQEQLSSIHGRLDSRRMTALLEPEDSTEEALQRSAARSEMGSVVQALRGYRGRVGRAEAAGFFARIDTARASLSSMRGEGGTLATDLERREREEMSRIRLLLDEEKASLVACATDAHQYEMDSHVVSGEIASESFRNVQTEFGDTVMRADMGAIDVYWMRKEEITDERERIRDERNQMIKELQRMYQDLLDFEEFESAELEEADEEEGISIE
jgi:tetratricopeptide (TPR) repeat protein